MPDAPQPSGQSDEPMLNEKALEAAARAVAYGLDESDYDDDTAQATITAYQASLAEQGIVLVDVREVAEFLREAKRGVGICGDGGAWREAAKFIEDHFSRRRS